jgi:hypothetical protein
MRRLLLACVAGAALALAGTALAAGGLTGTFTTTISGAPAAQFDGVWTMKIASSGRYSIAFGKHILISGQATQRPSTIVFGRETGPAACKGAQATGVYSWRAGGGRLTFTHLADKCPGRSFVLGHAFTRTA